MPTIRELMENHETVKHFFAGQNLDAQVRLSAGPGDVEIVTESPEKPGDADKKGKAHG